MLTMTVVFAAGAAFARMVGAWFAREAAAIKADIAVEIEKVQPDIAKVKSLLAKL